MEKIVKQLSLNLPVTYWTHQAAEQAPKILLLHGFMQTADRGWKLFAPFFDEREEAVVAIQAPFPVFRERSDRYDVGFSWFFYDPKTDTFPVDRDFAFSYLTDTLKQLGYLESLTTIIGYSQGGYLAPFLAKHLPNINQVIGVNARFRHENLTEKCLFYLDQVNGSDDQVVDPNNAKDSHEKLMNLGNQGDFLFADGTGHEVNPTVLKHLRALYEKRLKL